MRRIAVILVGMLVLSGCLSGPAPAGPSPTPTDQSTPPVPGIEDGRLTNASALVDLTEWTARYKGAVIQYNRSIGDGTVQRRMVFTPGGTPVSLTATRRRGDRSRSIDLWSNGSVTAVRQQTATETTYRTRPEGYVVDRPFAAMEQLLAAGRYTVSNASSAGNHTRLVAPAYVPGGRSPVPENRSVTGTLVIDDEGLIRELTLSTPPDGGGTMSYRLVRLGTERVNAPEWLAAIPDAAWLHPSLTVDVESERYLTVANRGSDPLLAGSQIVLTTNGTTYRSTIDAALAPEERLVAFIASETGSLVIAADAPDVARSRRLSSPVEIRILGPDGQPVHSGAIGWESVSATESGA